ncbi:MAG: hypothetical protein GXN96_05935, partial [Aquificae bacterium]|nr:hypothetical protein [Aquificota bacterium]
RFAKDKEEAFRLVRELASPDKVLLFLGAGSISRWCEELVRDEKAKV